MAKTEDVNINNASKSDMVNHPDHYTFGGIETIDYIEAKLPMISDSVAGYHWATVHKYLSRYPAKGTPVEDLKKAQLHLTWLIRQVEKSVTETWGSVTVRNAEGNEATICDSSDDGAHDWIFAACGSTCIHCGIEK